MTMNADSVERYLAPTRLQQALAALGLPGGATVLAGGTDLMPQGQAGRVRLATTLLNIRRVEGLDAIALDGDVLVLGALATITALREHPLVRAHAPLLAEAANHFASEQIRNAATLGGNLCNASPAGDMLPALLALDAEVELAALSNQGAVTTRRLPLDGFFTGPGRTQREPHELLTAVRVPLGAAGRVTRWHKAGTRPALDISTIAIAFAARRDAAGCLHDVRLALGAVAPTPLRAKAAEALLEGQRPGGALAEKAAQAAADAAHPIDDVRASAWYRRELVRNMTRRMLDELHP
ncbi:MAG TPA: xanthine dehydrogenase family protein subunit M [Ideonella sp.]|nr:xanthine dehydrogenase family protein subunit M [Ideonella sp.]